MRAFVRLAIPITAGLLAIASGHPPVVLDGPELQVNETTFSMQRRPAAAHLGRHRHVVVWEDSETAVFGRFLERGRFVSSELRLTARVHGRRNHYPDVCTLPGGGFVVVWGVNIWIHTLPRMIMARVFDGNGQPVGGAIEVSLNDVSVNPASVACAGEHGFVVVWAASDGDRAGVWARRFSVFGEPLGEAFRVNRDIAFDQKAPDVAMFRDGGFVVVWEGYSLGSNYIIYSQRFNARGRRVGSETVVNETAGLSQREPSVAVSRTGHYAVVWSSFLGDGSYDAIYGRTFSSTGAATGAEFQANSFVDGRQWSVDVAFGTSTFFLVTWQSDANQDGSMAAVISRLFRIDGRPAGNELLVNTYTLGRQQRPAVTLSHGHGFFVTWESYLQDGSLYGVFGQYLQIQGPGR